MWNFFVLKPDNDAQGVINYKQCFGAVAAGNTVNLYNQQHHHKIQYEFTMNDEEPHQKIPAARQETLKVEVQHFIIG